MRIMAIEQDLSFGQVRNLDYVINECKSIIDQFDNPELLGGGE